MDPGPDDPLFIAARDGDAATLGALLDADPPRLQARAEPYGWTLLHTAAQSGRLGAVDLLLRRGLDPNVREHGDRTNAMHWAAAGGHLEVVRHLADAGGDVVGAGDDHELEVIGWASCWHGCDDAAHRAVVDFLVERGARHHVYSAIALELPDELRRIAARDPAALERPMSQNENRQRPLHFAVRMNRPAMVALLIELGADPLGRDGDGFAAYAYATNPVVDLAVMAALRARGSRDLLVALSLGDFAVAEGLLADDPRALRTGGASFGALHLAAKRGDVPAVQWLLAHGADPNARWAHWDSEVTPIHLAALADHADVARLLVAAGASPTIRDSKHDSDALGWAEFFGRVEMREMLTSERRG